MRYKVDFLVVGSGIAGLSYALKVAGHGKVCILTKADASEGSTKYAQGVRSSGSVFGIRIFAHSVPSFPVKFLTNPLPKCNATSFFSAAP